MTLPLVQGHRQGKGGPADSGLCPSETQSADTDEGRVMTQIPDKRRQEMGDS